MDQLPWVRRLSPQLSVSSRHSLSMDQLLKDVEKLWQVDVIPFSQTPKHALQSKLDKKALECLDEKTKLEEINGIKRYVTPLLRVEKAPVLKASQEAVMPALRRMERRLAKDPAQAAIYEQEIQKLTEAGCVKKLKLNEIELSDDSWYIPHHLVEQNGKHCVVFNCSYQYQGESLNAYLLPGPVLGPSFIGVLLRFREHQVVISGDIRSMFHQVRLLASDSPFLRFLWRDMRREDPVDVYEWQVLPFGATCSPCCAIYALQKCVQNLPVEF